MLLNSALLKYPFSLLASSIIFLACKYFDYSISENLFESNKKILDFHEINQFSECLNFICNFWIYLRTYQFNLKFDAIYCKYSKCTNFESQSILPPKFTDNEINKWIYSK